MSTFKSRIEFNSNQHLKIRDFPLFSEGIERDQCHKMGQLNEFEILSHTVKI